MLNQVDWSEVVLDVACKERFTTYWNAFEKILKAQIEEMLKQECQIDKEQSWETSSDDGAINVSKLLDDNSFIKSDEDRYASVEYEGDGNNEDDE